MDEYTLEIKASARNEPYALPDTVLARIVSKIDALARVRRVSADDAARRNCSRLSPRPKATESSYDRNVEPQVLHITEADLVRDVRAILQRVQTGVEIIIERDAQPVAVLRAASPVRRTISECIALARAHEEESGSAPMLDADFAADVEAAVAAHREPLEPPAWD